MNSVRSVTVATAAEGDRRAATRQQILEATRQLLAQGHAFAKLSIQRIVEAAGISRATFYLHFRTKRELIAALAQSETGEWRQIAAPFLKDPAADRDALTAVVERLLALWREHRAVLAGIIELAEYDDDTRTAWRDTVHGIAQALETSVRARRGGLTRREVEQRCRLLVWAGERWFHQEAGDPAPESDRQMIASLTELIWKLIND